jgi:hypothetical protein
MGKFIALVVALAALLPGCGLTGGCENEVAARLPSPSGRLEAVVFNRGCGASVGFNTQLSIVSAGQVPEGGGNALILDGTVPLGITWISESSLEVVGTGGARAFKKEPSAADVSVSYR